MRTIKIISDILSCSYDFYVIGYRKKQGAAGQVHRCNETTFDREICHGKKTVSAKMHAEPTSTGSVCHSKAGSKFRRKLGKFNSQDYSKLANN